MAQGATVFLIDLGRAASGMQKALMAMGFQAGAGTQAQLAEVLGQALPQVIVAPLESHQAIATSLAEIAGAESVLVFLLSKDADGPMSRVPEGVAAVVPEDIDAGVLGLRIKAAAQTSIYPRQHQATLLGLPAGAIPSAPPAPQIQSEAPAPISVPASASAPAPVSTQPAPQRAPSVPPPLPRSVQPQAAPHVSVPPMPEQMSVSKIAVAPKAEVETAGRSATRSSPSALGAPDSEQPVASASPVAFSIPSTGLAEAPPNSSVTSRKTLLIAAAAVALLAGGGAVFFLGAAQEDAAQARASNPQTPPGDAKSAAATSPPSENRKPAASAAGEAAPSASAVAEVKPDEEQSADSDTEGAPSETDEGVSPEAEVAPEADVDNVADPGALAALFAITETSKMESCEELLGKTEADFAETVAWKSAHNWKLARKNLMSGKTQEAAKRMCESAFIDPSGPAVAGLVNYYLSERSLDQAYAWAKKGVEANPKSRSAKEALGDVLNQLGRVEEAKKVWLESFGLEDENDKRLAGVVRNYVRSADAARRGGAAPLAERLLRRALSFDEKNQGAATQLAGVLRKNSQEELAQRWDEYAASL